MPSGIVYWITGLAGSGKTTIATALYHRLQPTTPGLVFLDGDELRGVFNKENHFTVEDRKNLALSYSKLCALLSKQGLTVVIATISLFREIHEFNRTHLSRYVEIYIDCDKSELLRRDQKNIYSKSTKGEMKDVMGVDLAFDRPDRCDLVIDNTIPDNLEAKINIILEHIGKRAEKT